MAKRGLDDVLSTLEHQQNFPALTEAEQPKSVTLGGPYDAK